MHVPIHAAEDAMVMIKHGVAGFITLLFSWQRLPYYQNVAGLDLLLSFPYFACPATSGWAFRYLPKMIFGGLAP